MDRDPHQVALAPHPGAALGGDHRHPQGADGDVVGAAAVGEHRRVGLVGVEGRRDGVEVQTLDEVVDPVAVVVGDHPLAGDQRELRQQPAQRPGVAGVPPAGIGRMAGEAELGADVDPLRQLLEGVDLEQLEGERIPRAARAGRRRFGFPRGRNRRRRLVGRRRQRDPGLPALRVALAEGSRRQEDQRHRHRQCCQPSHRFFLRWSSIFVLVSVFTPRTGPGRGSSRGPRSGSSGSCGSGRW